MQAFWCLRDGNTIILTTKSVFKFKEYSTGTFIYIKTQNTSWNQVPRGQRGIKIYSLGSVQIYNTVLLATVTRRYIISPELSY